MKKIITLMMAMSSTMMLMAAQVNKFFNLQVNDMTRKYLLYVPNNVQDNAPLVISLHGAGGEYQISFIRPNKTDEITITNIGIYTMTDDDPTSVSLPPALPSQHSTFDLLGRPIEGQPTHNGIYIRNGKKIVVR